MAENLIGSEIIRLAGEINALIKQGQPIFNFTIGDFDPQIFPIPTELRDLILQAYQADQTNYPPADGMLELRQAVAHFLQRAQLNYAPEEILIAGGARPLIYAIYQTIVDPQDAVLFPVPSWNNNHYTHLSHGRSIIVATQPENNFLPSAEDLRPHLSEAVLLALCSPLNPTGTAFQAEQLREIAEMVLAENQRRSPDQKPLYLLYDQIYWTLTFGDTQHVDPVSLVPALRPYTIYVDGLSKAFAATGVRVGWAFGPKVIMDKMKSILGHVGAWAPKAEQVACARYLQQDAAIDQFLADFKAALAYRLNGIYAGLEQLRQEGFRVRAIAPQAAIYLTAQFDLLGMRTPEGKTLQTGSDITAYLLHAAQIAIVPFSAFGADNAPTWFRISVGTCKEAEVEGIVERLRRALSQLS